MLRIFIATLALISLPSPASAEIYKCRLPNGKTEIANVPCATGSGTVTVRPDEHVSEISRRAAEQDVERMRNYVEKREAAQRADEAAEREAQRAASQQSRNSSAGRPRLYGNAEECLRNVEAMVLEASQRSQMEAECRNLVSSPQPVYVPVGVPVPVYPQRHHVHPQRPPTPKAEAPGTPKISAPPPKK